MHPIAGEAENVFRRNLLGRWEFLNLEGDAVDLPPAFGVNVLKVANRVAILRGDPEIPPEVVT